MSYRDRLQTVITNWLWWASWETLRRQHPDARVEDVYYTANYCVRNGRWS